MHSQGPGIIYWMINDDVPSLLGPMDGDDLWHFIATRIDDKMEDIDAKAMIRKATNLDFEMELLGGDAWYAHNLIANKYSEGRIFLAGDACHLHPPFGGYGMNMGIGDGVDLGWKMAAVLQGWGGEELLASYETERRPVHKWIMDEAIANYSALGNQLAVAGIEEPGPVGDATRREAAEVIYTAKIREFKSLGAVLGYRYDGSPIVVLDGTSIPPQQAVIYQPSARPGCLAPHLWLRDGSSLYDHFGDGFTLLSAIGASEKEFERAEECAKGLAVPLKTIAPIDARLRRRYQANFALIRPDQHVAWRGDEIPKDFSLILRQVIGGGNDAPDTPETSVTQVMMVHTEEGGGAGWRYAPDMATTIAHNANSELAEAIRKNPSRFAGFASLNLREPLTAAKELERCIREFGFHGGMLHGHTGEAFLDHARFFPLWEAAEAFTSDEIREQES
jgi:hypothetical protein